MGFFLVHELPVYTSQDRTGEENRQRSADVRTHSASKLLIRVSNLFFGGRGKTEETEKKININSTQKGTLSSLGNRTLIRLKLQQ